MDKTGAQIKQNNIYQRKQLTSHLPENKVEKVSSATLPSALTRKTARLWTDSTHRAAHPLLRLFAHFTKLQLYWGRVAKAQYVLCALDSKKRRNKKGVSVAAYKLIHPNRREDSFLSTIRRNTLALSCESFCLIKACAMKKNTLFLSTNIQPSCSQLVCILLGLLGNIVHLSSPSCTRTTLYHCC